jgi:hypothetical protein
MSILRSIAHAWLTDFTLFSRLVVGRPLHDYQLAPALAILDSVLNQRGLEFAVMFPRQSGKNETQAQIEAFLLNVFQHMPGAQIVKAQPSFRPQAQNAMRRLEQVLRNDWNKDLWKRGPDYLVQMGEALCTFYSAADHANVVGATASVLLACDEAQAVRPEVWEAHFVPMTASTNATTVLWGTAWTAHTLLAGALRHLRALEAQDGVRRVFVAGPDEVAAANPKFAAAVRKAVARLGRQNPLVKSQYFNEELDTAGGLFPPDRRARMQGAHAPLDAPRPLPAGDAPFHAYAFLLDIGGEAQAGLQLAFPGLDGDPRPPRDRFDGRRDATALTIVEVDPSTIADPLLAAPTYRVVHRRQWVGVSHTLELHPALLALLRQWQPAHVVVDSTGLGHGTWSYLKTVLPEEALHAVAFSLERKSKLGWSFLAVCDAGRWQEPAADPSTQPLLHPLTALFWLQLAHVQYELRLGEKEVLAWGVPDGTRDPRTGGYLHDDLVISAALCAELESVQWRVSTGPGVILQGVDPLAELSRGF